MTPLNGEKIRLRALEPSDIEVLYAWENDPAIWLVSGTLAPFSKFVLEQYLTSAHHDIYTHKQLRLMIEAKQEDDTYKKAGCVDLFDFDPRNKRAGIGILIGDLSERKKGVATEAVQLMIHYSFQVLDLHQLYCNITTENEISLALFKKSGFEITGLKQDWIFDAGKWIDEYTLQLVKK